MSEIKNLIDEYSNEAVFWENQANQWRRLATVLAMEADKEEWTIQDPEIRDASAYELLVEQIDDDISVRLIRIDDGS